MNILENPLLMHAAKHVNDNFLSKPYKDAPHERYPKEGTIDGHIVFRPFHNLSQTLRKVATVQVAFLAYRLHRTTTFTMEGKTFRLEDEVEHIQLAFLFFVVGRESEISFQENPELYAHYRRTSSLRFMEYIQAYQHQFPQLKMLIASKRASLYSLIIHDAHTDTKIPFYDAIKRIFRICHRLDLPRCYTKTQYTAVNQDLVRELGITDSSKSVINKLEDFARRCLEATGEQNILLNQSRNPRRFMICSLSRSQCLLALSQVERPTF